MKLTREFDRAHKLLLELIRLTSEVLEHHRKRGDAGAMARLIHEERKNLKLLFHKLEKAKK